MGDTLTSQTRKSGLRVSPSWCILGAIWDATIIRILFKPDQESKVEWFCLSSGVSEEDLHRGEESWLDEERMRVNGASVRERCMK